MDAAIPLAVDQVLRFEGEWPCYGQVSALKEGKREGAWLATVRLLWGTPMGVLQGATLLGARELSATVSQLKGPTGKPYDLTLNGAGTLTLCDPIHSAEQLTGFTTFLHEVSRQHRPLIVIDPTGRFHASLDEWPTSQAGQQFKLSLQDYGINRFLKLVSEQLPPALQEDGLRLLAKQVPATADFIPFLHFLKPDKLADLPVKTPLLHTLFDFYQQGLFANSEEEAFALEPVLEESAVVLDLSSLAEAYKSQFYLSICQAIGRYAKQAGHLSLALALVHPDAYFPGWSDWAAAAAYTGISTIAVPAHPMDHRTQAALAQNTLRLRLDGQGLFQGLSTLGFPLSLTAAAEAEPQPTSLFNLPHSDRVYQAFPIPTAPEAPPNASAKPAPPPTSKPAPPPTSNPFTASAPQASANPEMPLTMSWGAPSPAGAEPPEPEWFDPIEPDWDAAAEVPAQPLSHDFEETPNYPPVTRLEDADVSTLWQQPEELPEQAETEDSSLWDTADDELPFFPAGPMIVPPDAAEQPKAGQTEPVPMPHPEPEAFSFDMDWEAPHVSPVTEAAPSAIPAPSSAPEPISIPSEMPSDAAPPSIPFIAPPVFFEEEEDPTAGNPEESIPVYKVGDPTQQLAAASEGFHEGDRIRNDKYGIGVVHKVIPMEGGIVLNVLFESVGKRLLDPSLSKVEKV